MKRRQMITWLATGGMLAGCRQQPITSVHEEPWIDLSGKWVEVSGGAVDENETLRLGWGDMLTAARWKGEIPEPPFELELEARRVDGTDFFCAVTFPARGPDECVTLVVGGWGGAVVGISSIDDLDAQDNETRTLMKFETGKWYRIRLVCETEAIRVWIDGEAVIDVNTAGRKLSLRPGPITDCAPFGLGTWQTTGEFRGIRWRGF